MDIKRERDQIKLDVKQVILSISYANDKIDSSRLAIEAAEKVVTGEFARFDIGQTSIEELLRARDLLAVTSRNFMRAVVDYNIALAELARAQGTIPHGVSITGSQTITLLTGGLQPSYKTPMHLDWEWFSAAAPRVGVGLQSRF